MNPKALVLLAPGCEEIETATAIDVLTRGEIDVVTASVDVPCAPIFASRGVIFQAQKTLEEATHDFYQVIVLPGGEGGSQHLAQSQRLKQRLLQQQQRKQWIAAICAAPALVLAPFGIITPTSKATGYPSTQTHFPEKTYQNQPVVIDHQHQLITSQGPATAIDFALAIVSQLQNPRMAQNVAEAMLHKL